MASYTITVGTPEHGGIRAVDEGGYEIASQEEGALVRVEAFPDEGYLLAGLIMNGEPMQNATFIMPATDVGLGAVFEAYEEVTVDLDSVAEAAENVQHFWTDAEGAHVTDMPQAEWLAAKEEGFPDISDEKPYANSLWTSLSMLFRTGLNNLVSISRSAVEFLDGLGNETANVVASFGKDGAQLGASNKSHLVLDYHSIQGIDKEGNSYFHVSDLRGHDGLAEMTEYFTGDGSTKDFRVQSDVVQEVSATDGSHSTNTARLHAPRVYTFDTAPNDGALVTIVYKTASRFAKAYTLGLRGRGAVGASSVAEGVDNIASGWVSHAEGTYTTASGSESHAEGRNTVASGAWSHAEGANTIASGPYSHAEGYNTTASGQGSHAQNWGTIAQRKGQTVLGEYNIADTGGTGESTRGEYAVIVGNGSSSARSNALAVKWDGTIVSGSAEGITQTVTIGDKTLTITGGIITGVS